MARTTGSQSSKRQKAAKNARPISTRGSGAVRLRSAQSLAVRERTSEQLPKPRSQPRAKETKSARAVRLLRRPEGATLTELMSATGWRAHSVRGFLSGTVRKRMQIAVQSKPSDAGRRYWIDSTAVATDAS